MKSTITYDRHEEAWKAAITDCDEAILANTWLRCDTLDNWRHNRLRKFILPLLSDDINASWLTVGDGRYGSDAHFLMSEGINNVHASDYSDILLQLGSQSGFINEYSAQNAEDLNFPDDSFDYVLCKDALHHFPRPFIALDEMFRVARKGVVLIEPRDRFIDRAWFQSICWKVMGVFSVKASEHGFETVGNYVYSISERELEKFMLGMHFTDIFFAGANDAYFSGVEFVSYPPKTIKDSFARVYLVAKIKVLNLLQNFAFSRSRTLIACILKSTPSHELVSSMKKHGWSYKNLPKNPYI